MIFLFHIIPRAKIIMSKHRIDTRFDTLAHKVGDTLVTLYVHPLFFLSTKVFINIHGYANEKIFISDDWMKKLIKLNH